MKISFFTDYTALNGRDIMHQFSDIVSSTDKVVFNDLTADVAVIWSVLWYGRMAPNLDVWQTFRQNNKNVIVCEVGGLKRNETWRFSLNGINADATFPRIQKDPERYKKMGLELKPWDTDGDYYVICGQHGMSEQWRNLPPVRQYYQSIVNEIRRIDSETDIIIRDHPRWQITLDQDWMISNKVHKNVPKKLVDTYDNFDFIELLQNAKAVVSESSNPGIEAAINGIPIITGPNHLARPVGSTLIKDIIDPKTPDRESWFKQICHKEFFLDELETMWQGLRSSALSLE